MSNQKKSTATRQMPAKPVIITAGVLTALCLLIFSLFQFIVARGPSMEPTIHEMDALLMLRNFGREIEVGDIVVVYDESAGYNVVKRVAATPGQEVKVVYDGSATVTYDYWGSSTLPDGFYFVLGDNPAASKDSRDPDFGIVSEDQIIGFVTHIFHR